MSAHTPPIASIPSLKVLLTRPEPESYALSVLLAAHNIQSFIDPLLSIHTIPPIFDQHSAAEDTENAQAFVVTSLNGVRAIAAMPLDRNRPLYAVGERTAAEARSAGFRVVFAAEGDVGSLAALLCRMAHPHDGPLVHFSGVEVAGDLKGMLQQAGFTAYRHCVYEARPATQLRRDTVDALKDKKIDAGVFFSPRTASTFARVLRCHALEESVKTMTAFCLSQAIADAMDDLMWHCVVIAPHLEQNALIDCITAFAHEQDQGVKP